MLHLIYQSLIDHVVLKRIDNKDDVVFLENAVFSVIKDNFIDKELHEMLNNDINIHVLNEELETRGINKNKLIVGINVIDYPGLVKLTEKNKIISTWN